MHVENLGRATGLSPIHQQPRMGGVGRVLAAVHRLWIDWKARRDLERLPDAILNDVGLSRADVVRESLQPFWAPLDYEHLELQRRIRARRSSLSR